jgi:hypothetical protein
MPSLSLPRMVTIRQEFPSTPRVDVPSVVKQELARTVRDLKPNAKIAVGVGSRGISNLQGIVSATLEFLKQAGTEPYIVPAMGSHGGATPSGQTGLLADYGVSEQTLKVPVRAAMDSECIGQTEDGVDVFCSAEALRADGVIVINRVKPHTDFQGSLGSGILKMLVIGLGKRTGAANFHILASRFGYEHVIRTSSRVTLRRLPVLCGLAVVENQRHETARISALGPNEIESGEGELFKESVRLMPRLPFDDIDLLIVDQIGKNISGAGMDPNIVGRGVHGYTSSLSDRNESPVVRRLFVRELTRETHGNAIGIGNADFTTIRLVKSMDQQVTAINALTALTVQSAKIPIQFETDREAIERALDTLALKDRTFAKVMRIRDTLSVETVQVSEAFLSDSAPPANLQKLSTAEDLAFDADGNLAEAF